MGYDQNIIPGVSVYTVIGIAAVMAGLLIWAYGDYQTLLSMTFYSGPG